MHLRRFADGVPYQPAGHVGMSCLKLQGNEAGPMNAFWMATSVIAPGGHILSSASPLEKAYIVLEGELTITAAGAATILHKWDSCRVAPHEAREIENHSDLPAVLLLTMAKHPDCSEEASTDGIASRG